MDLATIVAAKKYNKKTTYKEKNSQLYSSKCNTTCISFAACILALTRKYRSTASLK
jgi:hypothetical protein